MNREINLNLQRITICWSKIRGNAITINTQLLLDITKTGDRSPELLYYVGPTSSQPKYTQDFLWSYLLLHKFNGSQTNEQNHNIIKAMAANKYFWEFYSWYLRKKTSIWRRTKRCVLLFSFVGKRLPKKSFSAKKNKNFAKEPPSPFSTKSRRVVSRVVSAIKNFL